MASTLTQGYGGGSSMAITSNRGHSYINNPPPVTTAGTSEHLADYYKLFTADRLDQAIDKTYENQDVEVPTLPKAYIGHSDFWSNTMQLQALLIADFMTAYILPLNITQHLHTNWVRHEFPAHLPDRVPHRGIVRRVEKRQTSGGVAMVRRGIGVAWEHAYAATPEGREVLLMHIHQINQAINTALQLDGIYALLTVENEHVKYLRSLQAQPQGVRDKHMQIVMEREVDTWAIFQQQRNAWKILMTSIDKAVQSYNQGTVLDTVVTDDRALIYLNLFPEEQTQYYLSGENAVRTLNTSATDFKVDSFGNRLYFVRAFLNEGGIINPLEAKTQIGEHFISYCPCSKDSGSNYLSNHRTMKYFNEDLNMLDTITLKEMFDNCNRFDERGEVISLVGNSPHLKPLNYMHPPQTQAYDFLHYVDADGNLKPCKYFGQINEEHMSKKTYEDQAACVLRRLHKLTGLKVSDITNSLNQFRNLMLSINETVFDADLAAYVQIVSSLPKNKYGSTDVPTTDGDAFKNWKIPPTHGDYAGAKTIADMVEAGTWDTAGYSPTAGKTVAKGVEIIDTIVPYLKSMFPTSVLFKADNSLYNSNFGIGAQYASEAFSFVENALLSDVPRRRFFTSTGAAASGVASQFFTAPKVTPLIDEIRKRFPIGENITKMIRTGITGHVNIDNDTRQITWAGDHDDTSLVEKYGNAKGAEGKQLKSQKYKSTSRKGYNHALTLVELLHPVDNGMNTKSSVRHAIEGEYKRAIILNTLANVAPVGVTKNDTADEIKEKRATSLGKVIEEISDKANISMWYDGKPRDSNYYVKVNSPAQLSSIMHQIAKDNPELFIRGADNIANTMDSLQGMYEDSSLQDLVNQANEDGTGEYTNLQANHRKMSENRSNFQYGTVNLGSRAVNTFPEFMSKHKGEVTFWPESHEQLGEPMSLRELSEGYRAANDPAYRRSNSDHISTSIGPEFAEYPIEEASKITNLPFVRRSRASQTSERARELLKQQQLHKEAQARLVRFNNRDALSAGMRQRMLSGDSNIGLEMSRTTHGSNVEGVEAYSKNLQARTNQLQKKVMRGPVYTGDDIAHREGVQRFNDLLLKNRHDQQNRAKNIQEAQQFGATNIRKTYDMFIEKEFTPNMIKLYKDFSDPSFGIAEAAIARVFMFSEINKQAMEATISQNIIHPFNYLCVRPHARYTTVTLIKCKAGLETGSTHIGHLQTEIGNEALTGMGNLSVFYYSAAEVRKHSNVFVQRNCMVVGYHGGLGNKMYVKHPHLYNPQIGKYGNGSFFIFAIPREEKITHNPITLTGVFTWGDINATAQDGVTTDSFGLTHSTAVYYSRFWGFANHRFNYPVPRATFEEFKTAGTFVPNEVCYLSHAQQYCPSTESYKTVSGQTGHWKPCSFNRDARVGKTPMDTRPFNAVLTNMKVK